MATASGQRALTHQATQDRVKQFILDHGYQPGDLLPPEAELAAALGVSRPSLREAIRALQTLGVVESRHGAGTFVGHFSLAPLIDGLAFSIRVTDEAGMLKTIREILHIREILEGELIADAVHVLTTADLARLAALVETMEHQAAQGTEFSAEDRAFHQALYQPLGNPLVVQLIQAFWDVFHRVRDQLPEESPELQTIASDHRRIVEALQRRDRRAAAAAMTIHFAGIQRRIDQSIASGRNNDGANGE